MRRTFGRLLQTERAELTFRCRQLTRIGLEKVRVASGRERWQRRRLPSILISASDEIDAARTAASRGNWIQSHQRLRAHFLRRPVSFLIDPADRHRMAASVRRRFPASVDDAVARASSLIHHRYDLLGYCSLSFQREDRTIDWHWDPVSGRSAPLWFWSDVPYLDSRYGDHKVIWELNRHQHWLALGRAAWLSEDPRYSFIFRSELDSWLNSNPPLVGINWASMLELAFRSISWIWAMHFFAPLREEPDQIQPWLVDLFVALDRQLNHISHHLSVYFSPNTHLLGEGVALYVAGRALPELRSARRWEAQGRRVLLREAEAQILADGAHAELSLHYHRYALDFYLLALAVARKTSDPSASWLSESARRLATFCRTVADDDGRLAMIGDDDGGSVFPIAGRKPDDVRDSLALAAVLLDQPSLALGTPPEEVAWMLGDADRLTGTGTAAASPSSRALRDSGYVVLRTKTGHAIFDAGRHGFLNGGHAHSDALSLVLTIDGHPLLIDPGTATYTMSPATRDRFRSTIMHNTLVVDGRPQSTPAGPFHWAAKTDSRLEVTRLTEAFDYVEAAHDAFAPLVHRRALLRVGGDLWLVADHVLGEGSHTIDAHWHLDPSWSCDRTSPASVNLTHTDGSGAGLGSTATSMHEFHADDEGLGWSSPAYGRAIGSTTLRFSRAGQLPMSIVTAVVPSASARTLDIQTLSTSVERRDRWHRIAVRISQAARTDIALFASPGDTVGAATGARELQHISTDGGELVTDARVALLRLSANAEPESLVVVDASAIVWTGRVPFELTLGSARDLHFDMAALQRLSRRLADVEPRAVGQP